MTRFQAGLRSENTAQQRRRDPLPTAPVEADCHIVASAVLPKARPAGDTTPQNMAQARRRLPLPAALGS